MENFFVDDKFYRSLEDYIQDLECDDDLSDLPDCFLVEATESDLEKIFQVDIKFVVNAIMNHTDKWDDRFPEDDERVVKTIKNAIELSIDIDKLNSNLPDLYYPNGKKFVITKQDLLDFIN